MKNKRYIFGLFFGGIILLLLALWLSADSKQKEREASERDYQEVLDSKALRVLTSYSAYTREEKNKQVELKKLIDYLKAKQGLKVVLEQENDRSLALEKLLSGKVDLLADRIVLTSRIDTNKFAFLNEEYCEPIYLVQRADSLSLKSQLELANKDVYLPKASELKLFVEHLSREISEPVNIKLDELYTTEQLILKVLDAKIDYTLCSAEEAKYYSERFPELDFTLPISFSLRRAWLVRKSSPILRDSLETWLKRIEEQKK